MKIAHVVRAAIAPLVLVACAPGADQLTDPTVSMELTDPTKRIDAGDVNAHVYGSFVIEVAGTPGGVILSGPANFPGNPPAGPGTCDNGRWINSQGKGTSGSVARPHPHCVGAGSGTVSIVLEPISAENKFPGNSGNEQLNLAKNESDGQVKYISAGNSGSPKTQGHGVIEAWAIDAATLGTTNTRVGKITIDLTQFNLEDVNLFAVGCEVGSTARCLNKIIDAGYTPLPAPNGLGAAQTISGFLYWSAATSPFNYTP